MRKVDPLEPQPGDRVRIYTPHDKEDLDHPINWDEGIVDTNTEIEIVLVGGYRFQHEFDENYSSVYYIVEDEA